MVAYGPVRRRGRCVDRVSLALAGREGRDRAPHHGPRSDRGRRRARAGGSSTRVTRRATAADRSERGFTSSRCARARDFLAELRRSYRRDVYGIRADAISSIKLPEQPERARCRAAKYFERAGGVCAEARADSDQRPWRTAQLTYDGFADAVLRWKFTDAKDVTVLSSIRARKVVQHGGVCVSGFAVGGEALIGRASPLSHEPNPPPAYGAPSVVQFGACARLRPISASLSAPVAEGYRVRRRDAFASVRLRLGQTVEPARGCHVPGGTACLTGRRPDVHASDARRRTRGREPRDALRACGAGYYRVSFVAEPPVLEAAVQRMAAACAARGWR
jgi:hypothetical protein